MKNLPFPPIRKSALWLSCAVVSAASANAVAQGSLTTIPVTAPSALKQSTVLRAASPSQVVHLAISLPSPNLPAFEAYVNDVSNPKSPNFHKWLTPAQVGTKFGASTANLLQVENYLRAEGFKIKLVAASHLQIMADATVFQADSAFHTKINLYHSKIANDPGRVDYYSIATSPAAPTAIASKISYISGLQNHTQPISRMKKALKQTSNEFLVPATTSVFYDTAVMHTAGFNGQGKTVAVSSFGGFDLTNVPLYVNTFGLPIPAGGVGSNITVKPIDGGLQFSGINGEADLDYQMVLNQAPLSNILIYDCAGAEIDCLIQEANDNLADTLTESYGFALDAGENAACHTVRLQMSAQGMTYANATGDDGADSPVVQEFPAPNIDPEVTNVGGTTVTFGTTGTRTTETGWSGSEGGWILLQEPFNVLPTWMVGTGVPTNINFRLMPDVAMDSDPDTGEEIYIEQTLQPVGGTSEAAPMWAAAIAVTEQYLASRNYFPSNTTTGNRFGRINDLLYAQNGNSTEFFDCLVGANGTLPNGAQGVCTPGWDFVTGWGALDFYGFAQHLVTAPPQKIVPTSVSIYTSNTGPMAGIAQGSNLAGSSLATLLTNDGVGYTEDSVPNEVGPIAANTMTFQLSTGTVDPVGSATLNFAQTGPSLVTTFYYLKNVTTGALDLVGSVAMTGSEVTYSLPVTLSKYLSSSKQLTVVTRSVGPARLFNTPYQITIDEASLLETFQ